MSGTSNTQLAGDIGELKGVVSQLVKAVDINARAGAEGRAKIHEKLEVVNNRMATIEHKVELTAIKVESMFPITEEFVKARERVKGARWLGRFLWVFGLGILGVAAKFMGLFDGLFPR